MRSTLCTLLALVCLAPSVARAQAVTRLTPTSPDYLDDFSAAVAVTEADDGGWALVGAPGDNDATGDAGSVFAYYRTAEGWQMQGQLFAPGEPLFEGGFGSAVALSGRLAVVTEAGWAARERAYVLRREGEGLASAWVVEAVLEPEVLADSGHVFGVSVALDTSAEAEADGGFVAVVGAVTRGLLDPVPGAAHAFRRDSAGVWQEEAVLRANEGEVTDRFGRAVATNAGRILVGAYYEGQSFGSDTSGATYVYTHGVGTWNLEARLEPSEPEGFGISVSLDDEWALIGSDAEDCGAPDFFTQCGAAYFYRRTETGWRLHRRFQPIDLTDADYFGNRLALALPYAVVAAPLWDTAGPNNAGAAYLYRLDTDTWRFERLLQAPDPGPLDQFGRSVALASDTVGAPATALVGTIEALGAAYALDLAPTVATESAAPEPTREAIRDLRVYPNPSTNGVRIAYELAAPAAVRVEIADLLGRVVWARALGQQGAGAHDIALEGLSLPAGTYLVRLSAGDTAAATRFTRLPR